MLKRLWRLNICGAVLLLASTGLTLSGDARTCNASHVKPVGSLELAEMAGETKWCCCGGCCGYATDCTAVPGCVSC